LKLRHVAAGAVVLVAIGQYSDDSGVVPGSQDVAGPSAPAKPSQQSPSSSADHEVGKTTAVVALNLLAVKGRASMTGYVRDRFGPAWLDADRNGCDTRNDILGEHLDALTLESNGCVVVAGSYEDPYTGFRIDYWQGHGDLVDIDHMVSLGNAWATGAFGWQIKKRAAFANDPLNLLPADASANRQKGDGDAATWLPANNAFRCEYVSHQVAVKDKYDLWVTRPEKAAILRVLASCDGQALAVDDWGAPTEVDHNISDPIGASDDDVRADSSAVPTSGPSTDSGPVQFNNCDDARAAGSAPVRVGDPGYGRHLDGDGDGTGCE
jgi:hypothetical protein